MGLQGALEDIPAGDQHRPGAGVVVYPTYNFMYKLVLYNAAELAVRLRLHVYQAGFFDRPHNHRWSFASHILRGGYVHRIFGSADQFGEDSQHHFLARPQSVG